MRGDAGWSRKHRTPRPRLVSLPTESKRQQSPASYRPTQCKKNQALIIVNRLFNAAKIGRVPSDKQRGFMKCRSTVDTRQMLMNVIAAVGEGQGL